MTVSQVEGEYLTLHELIKIARAKLDGNLWDYLVGGTATETTLRRNRQAIDSIAFRPRVLRDVSKIDGTSSFYGRQVRLPVCLAPIGGLEALGSGGGMTVAPAASAYGVPFIVSSVTNLDIAKIAEASNGGPIVFQLYPRGNADWVDDYVQRVIDAGYDALCLTVDSAVYSRRERDIAKRFAKPWRGRGGHTQGKEFQAAFNWSDIERIRSKYDIDIILKGIASPEDAEMGCEAGISGVYISNHGGRQLDHGYGAIEMLPEIVDAVAGRATIMIDGGFSRGSDVVKAIALGADMVGIGRLYCYGLAAAGGAGVTRILELLESEIYECLGLLGLTDCSQLDKSCVGPTTPVDLPSVHSAFPLMALPDDVY